MGPKENGEVGDGHNHHGLFPAAEFLPLALALLVIGSVAHGLFGPKVDLLALGSALAILCLCQGWAWTSRLRTLEDARIKDREALRDATRNLVESEAKARTLLEGAGSALGLINASGVIQEVNRRWEAVFGLERSLILGRPAAAFLSPSDKAYLEARMRKLVSGSELVSTEWEVNRPDGSKVVVESFPAKVELGGEPYILVALNDVTERNRLRRQAALNERLTTVGTLAAGIVHEINNPTAVALGNLEMMTELLSQELPQNLQSGANAFNRMSLLANRALDATVRIKEIVGSLKGFARTEEDQQTPVDLVGVIESAITMTNHVTKDKARVVRDFPPGLPTILGNGGRLQQLFINLLVNAAQAIIGNPSKNRITVRLRKEEECIRVELEDTGEGIPPSVLPRIFDPFFTTKPVGEGSGLGLPICHEIVRQHRGVIGIESVEGQGSRFYFTLSTLGIVDLPEELGPALPSPTRVLLVDDDPLVLLALKRVLRRSFHLFTAEGGRAAIGVLAREDIQAIVTDLNMPDVNGMDLYQHVAGSMPSLANRFIFFTGGTQSPEFQGFLASKGLPCLDKPFGVDELRAHLS